MGVAIGLLLNLKRLNQIKGMINCRNESATKVISFIKITKYFDYVFTNQVSTSS